MRKAREHYSILADFIFSNLSSFIVLVSFVELFLEHPVIKTIQNIKTRVIILICLFKIFRHPFKYSLYIRITKQKRHKLTINYKFVLNIIS